MIINDFHLHTFRLPFTYIYIIINIFHFYTFILLSMSFTYIYIIINVVN